MVVVIYDFGGGDNDVEALFWPWWLATTNLIGCDDDNGDIEMGYESSSIVSDDSDGGIIINITSDGTVYNN